MEDKADPAVQYNRGLDPLSRQYQQRYNGQPQPQGATPIRNVSLEPKFNPDTMPRGPLGPPGGTLPVLRSGGSGHSPVGKGNAPSKSQAKVQQQRPKNVKSHIQNQPQQQRPGPSILKGSPNTSQTSLNKLRASPVNHSPHSSSHHPRRESPSPHVPAHTPSSAPSQVFPPGQAQYMNIEQVSAMRSPHKHSHPPPSQQQQPSPNHPGSGRLSEQHASHNQSYGSSNHLQLPSPSSSHSPGATSPNRGIQRHTLPTFAAPRQDFNAIRRHHHEKGTLFEDREFPPEDSSLYYSRRPPYDFKWMRPRDIAGQYRLPAELFVDGASRFDLVQGELGDCWLVAATACMSEHPHLLEAVLPPGQSFHSSWYAGCFLFRFWSSGEWVEVVIDDLLPTVHGRLVFVHSRSNNEFWGALLEKAYAKLFGSYEALKGGHVGDALQDFTGGIIESYELHRQDPPLPKNLTNIVFHALEKHCLIGCGINPVDGGRSQETVLPNGLVCGHAYSVTDLREIQLVTDRGSVAVTLIRVRNPWGTKTEWNGAWSDRSRQWTSIPPHDRHAMGLTFRDDGEFWMDWHDFLKYFNNLDLCYLTPEHLGSDKKSWAVNCFHGRWRKGVNAGGRPSLRETHYMNPQYRVILTDHDDDDDKCSFMVELQQKDRRRLKHKGLQLVPIGFVIYQLSRSYKSPLPQKFFDRHRYVERCDYFTNARTVSKRFLVNPGEYVIVPSTFDANINADFLLRISFEKENKARDVDEPVEVIDPEPQPVEPDPPDRELTFKKFFYDTAGQDMLIDPFEFRQVLNKGLSHDKNHREIGIDACKVMVSLVDMDGHGKLGYYEFQYLWNMIRSWKKTFYASDRNNNASIDGYELRKAIASQGYRMSSTALHKMLMRYGNQKNEIDLDHFIICMCRVLSLFNIFKQHSSDDEAHFKLNSWLEATIAL